MKNYINIALIATALFALSGCTEETASETVANEDNVVLQATAVVSCSGNTLVTWEIDKSRNVLPYGQLAALSNNSYYASEQASFNCGGTGEPTCSSIQTITCEETGYTGTKFYFRCHLNDDTANFIEFNVQDKEEFHLYTMLSGWESKSDRDNGAYADNFDVSGSIDYE